MNESSNADLGLFRPARGSSSHHIRTSIGISIFPKVIENPARSVKLQKLNNPTWENVSLERKQITLLKTKSGKRQIVRLNSAALSALGKLGVKSTGSVCPDGNDEWAHRNWWDDVRTAAKVSDFHWHDLRHTFASRLVMAGVDIYTVSKLMRHGSVKVTERYAHLAATHLEQAVERLPASVAASVTVPGESALPAARMIH
jgi:Phage integrase family